LRRLVPNDKGDAEPTQHLCENRLGENNGGINAVKEDTNNDRKVRGEHYLHTYVSYALKSRLKALAEKYDRTTSDIVRAVLQIGIPMLEGMSQSEEIMVREYVRLFHRLRQVRTLKEI
jgi:hypothetical protein